MSLLVYVYARERTKPERKREEIRKTSNKTARETTYSLLHLSLVCLDLGLELVDDFLKALLVLAILVALEGQLLQPPVCLPHVLLSLSMAALLVVKLDLQLAYLSRRPLP